MPAFLVAHPYLAGCLILVAATLAGYALAPAPFRRPMTVSGCLMAPFALCSVLVVPEYWHPDRVAVFLAGPEDVVFSATCGCLAWLFAAWPVRRRLSVALDPRRIARRYLFGTVAGLALWLLARKAGALPMSAAAVAAVLVSIFLLWRLRWSWPLALSGSAGFTLFYFAFVQAVFALFPGVVDEWNPEFLLGARLLGIPLDEVLWAATFGAAWPLFAGWMFDARLAARSPGEAAVPAPRPSAGVT